MSKTPESMPPIRLEDGADGLTVDPQKLVATCALVQGTRGSGKSYFARVVVEQTIAAGLQTIILDPEGEYCTLREKHDILIAGPDADVPCELRSAALMARQLAEVGVSAVVDYSQLHGSEGLDFVAAFLTAFEQLPKSLRRHRLFVIDESHKVCPESGKGRASSKDAVRRLMDQGRKRGHGAMLLTQRLAKLSNDAAAEAGNVFIGRTSAIDVARAQDLLGISAKERDSLRKLANGHFFGVGPACSHVDVRSFQCRRSETTHPDSSDRINLSTPPPKRALKKILQEFAALAAAANEVQEAEEGSAPARPSATDLRAAEARGHAQGRTAALRELDGRLNAIRQTIGSSLQQLAQLTPGDAAQPVLTSTETARPGQSPNPAKTRRPSSESSSPALGSGGIRRLMLTLAQHPEGIERTPLALYSRLTAKGSGTLSRYLSTLKSSECARTEGSTWYPTALGIAALGPDWAALPTGEALVDYWRSFIGGGGERRIFDALNTAGRSGLSRDALAEAAGLASGSGTFARYLSRLRSLQLIQGSNHLRIANIFQ